MKRILTIGAVAALSVGMLMGPAMADTAAENRQAKCAAMATDPDVTATYLAGTPSNVNTDRCEVVSTATTVTEASEQVNNPRAAKAVVRTVKTSSTVTTTQMYKWATGQTQNWVAEGDALIGDALETYEECMVTPGLDKCA